VLGSAQGLRRIEGDPVANAVARIAGGKAGAIYSQRMEFGPRALGARTILGSPADHRINDDLNRRLERSEFMPFAPVITESRAREVFDITDANAYACRFMTITCAVKPEWRERIPAVVHVDGTARPQIITRGQNPLYHDILEGFETQTGLPVLINTSFNAAGRSATTGSTLSSPTAGSTKGPDTSFVDGLAAFAISPADRLFRGSSVGRAGGC
jgi:carbamoyltransferase